METIKVKYFSEDVAPLEYVDGKSDWIDLCAAQEVTLRAREFRLIPLGVAMGAAGRAMRPTSAPPQLHVLKTTAFCRPTAWAWWTSPTAGTATSGTCPSTPPGT